CLDALIKGNPAQFGTTVELAKITRFTVFEAESPAGCEQFTLILELEGIDENERRAAVTAHLLPTPKSFIDFVRMLLGDLTAIAVSNNRGDGDSDGVSRPSGRLGLAAVL